MKVLIKFNNDFIQFFDYDEFKNPAYSRTNVLDLQEIVLSENFIMENYNFIVNFIKNKVVHDNINKVFIDKIKINKLVFNLIYHIENLTYFYINENKKVDTELFNYILTNKNIKDINCYDINPITFERLNFSKNIKITTRKKYCDDSYIYHSNNMNTYSDVYYNEEIVIDKLLQKKDLEKINEYLKINRFLCKISIKYFDKKNTNELLKLLKKNNKSHIKIEIFENDYNIKNILNNINTIKNKNKKYLKKNKIYIKIKYENSYIKKNIFKAVNLNFMKTILLSIIVLTIFVYSLFYVINEINTNNTVKVSKRIDNIIESIKLEKPEPINKEPEQPKVDENNIKTEKPKKKSAYFQNYSKAISELKKINKETIGWLSLNNTKISYPIVKANNNEKYLVYSFDGSKNPNGWLFLDYRNDPKGLSRNNIIYGHSGNYYVMFGSLKNTLNPSWYKNTNNQYITFNTETNSKKWQIFSMYTINVTSDYLVTDFENDEEYVNFLTRMKERSIYNFGVELGASDKILTLSTCHGDGSKRLVIHAKLLQ